MVSQLHFAFWINIVTLKLENLVLVKVGKNRQNQTAHLRFWSSGYQDMKLDFPLTLTSGRISIFRATVWFKMQNVVPPFTAGFGGRFFSFKYSQNSVQFENIARISKYLRRPTKIRRSISTGNLYFRQITTKVSNIRRLSTDIFSNLSQKTWNLYAQ